MHAETLSSLGYAALVLGTMLEGEAVLLLAGLAVAGGTLDFWSAVAAAMFGSVAGDLFFFRIGRNGGTRALARCRRFARTVERAQTWLEKYKYPLLVSYRFLYGLRAALPFALGLTGLNPGLFAAVSLFSAGAWSVGGIFCGAQAARLMDDPLLLRRLPLAVAAIAGLIGGTVLLCRAARNTVHASRGTTPNHPPATEGSLMNMARQHPPDSTNRGQTVPDARGAEAWCRRTCRRPGNSADPSARS